MLGTVEVRLVHTKAALRLTDELMTRAGYPPTERSDYRVRWTSQKDSTHTCEISFQIFRGLGYISYFYIFNCDCKERWAFGQIISALRKELSSRGWGVTRQYRIFHSTGIP